MITPKELGLPKRFEQWRPGQWETIERISQSQKYAFLLDAPWGIGKSIIGIGTYLNSEIPRMVMRRMQGEDIGKAQCIYVTRTIQLQKQILREFPKARAMVGRSNYPCLKHKNEFPEYTAEDCRPNCDQKMECPYHVDKALAVAAPLVVLNDAYYLAEINGPGQFGQATLLIIDEVDSLESALMNHIQLSVSEAQLEYFQLDPPKNTTNIQDWLSWSTGAGIELSRKKDTAQRFLTLPEDMWGTLEIDMNRMSNRLESLSNKLNMFISDADDTWVVYSNKDKKGKSRWIFKPITIHQYSNKYLWRHAGKVLGMSATILAPDLMANDLGIPNQEYFYLDSPFPVENRPIYYQPWVETEQGREEISLSYNRMAEELPKLARRITEILQQYPDKKGLIHTTSYPVRDYLLTNLPQKRLISHDTSSREEKLREFKASTEPLVMLSPSFDRGVDLPQEQCSFIIICKVPYIGLSDPQVKARMKLPGGQRWYLIKALQTVIQMSGRGVRSPMDKCDTYILDHQFSRLLRQTGAWIPAWWRAAIIK